MSLNISEKNTNFEDELVGSYSVVITAVSLVPLALPSDTRRPGRFIELHILSAVRSPSRIVSRTNPQLMSTLTLG
jgi:hypothetical protein